MAGRPRTMLKRVTTIEETAFQLAADVAKIRPQQYADRENSEGDDEVALAWNGAVRAMATAATSLEELLFHLEERAGMDAEARQQERELRRHFPDLLTEANKTQAVET